MKSFVSYVASAIIVVSAKGQINTVRYSDNFTYLKSDSIPKKGFEQFKYISLSKSGNISFGGELREQLQYYRHINFGDVPPSFKKESTWQLWHRLMAHANLELGTKLRLFTQLGSTFRFLNPNPLTPEIDQNQLSLHQAFVDYHFDSNWMTRMGRQEISYGAHRLITFREGPNTRLAFDGAIIKHHSSKREVDLLALSPVISRKGIFDDGVFKDFIAGLYGTENLIEKKLQLDYYILNFSSRRRQYNYVNGIEDRKIVGARILSAHHHLNYEIEATYQFGKFNDLSISAYSISADINFKMPVPIKSVIGLAGNYVSGDRDKSDSHLNTYNLLFAKPQYGLTAPIGATNIATINLYLRVAPNKKSKIYAGANFMWRQSKQDGIYSPAAVQVRTNLDIASLNKMGIGTLILLDTNYNLNNRLSFSFDASHFIAAGYVSATGKGKNITYLSFKAGYKF